MNRPIANRQSAIGNRQLISLRADLTAFWPGERVDLVINALALPRGEEAAVRALLGELGPDEGEMLQQALDRGLVSGDWRRSAVRRRLFDLQVAADVAAERAALDLDECAREAGERMEDDA